MYPEWKTGPSFETTGTEGELKTVSAWTVHIGIDFFPPVNFLSILNITKETIFKEKRTIYVSSFVFRMEKSMRVSDMGLLVTGDILGLSLWTTSPAR